MSIRCVCTNGHVLNVPDSQAGATGLCPTCKAKVQVPLPLVEPVSEDEILGFLGQSPTGPKPSGSRLEAVETAVRAELQERGTPKKSCYKCNQEIAVGTHVCPWCHTYIAKLDDF
jgi:hypothetical protein